MLPPKDENASSNKKSETTKLLTGKNNRFEELAVQDFLTLYNYQRLTNVAYYLWFFLGLIGVHHIYLRRYYHFLLCVLWIWIISGFRFLDYYWACFIGAYVLVWIIDGFRIRHLVDVANNRFVPKEKKVNPWSVYDIYLCWIPPLGFGGYHHFYTGYYWRFITYIFSAGFLGVGWLVDIILIPFYYYPKLKQSFLDKIENKKVLVKHYKTLGQLWMCWFPLNGILGFHHFYCGDITLGICYCLSFGGYFLGWLIDICLLGHYYRRFDENIEKQFDKWKKENDIGNVSAVDRQSNNFQPKYPFIFKKTYYHAYLTWFSGLGFLGLQHLYLHNWAILLGHILTVGGCGVFWIADFFLLPKFVRYTNERLGLNETSDETSFESADKNVDNDNINNKNDIKMQEIVSNIQINEESKKIDEETKGNNEDNKYDNDNKSDNDNTADNNGNKDQNDVNINRNVVISNLESKENKQIKQIQRTQLEDEKRFYYALYTTYLYWTPLMGFIGVYYIYLGKYKQFFMRFMTLNFWLIGWIVDIFRIPELVREKLKEEAQNIDDQKEHLIQ